MKKLLLIVPVLLLAGCMNIETNTTITEHYNKDGKVTQKVTESQTTDNSFTLGTKGGNEEVNIIPLTVSGIN